MSPSDSVISKIKEMISAGILKPGDRLPAERKMADDFGFGRTQIREALHKLEIYGIIKTLPQSGSVINSLDISALDGLIADVMQLQEYDFYSLVETRILLEVNAISLCAERWTATDMKEIELAHNNFLNFWNTEQRQGYDFAFHRAIAAASHNYVIKSMLMIITPDILDIYNKERFCPPSTIVVEEHIQMLDAIKNHDVENAATLMKQHLQGVLDFAKLRISVTK